MCIIVEENGCFKYARDNCAHYIVYTAADWTWYLSDINVVDKDKSTSRLSQTICDEQSRLSSAPNSTPKVVESWIVYEKRYHLVWQFKHNRCYPRGSDSLARATHFPQPPSLECPRRSSDMKTEDGGRGEKETSTLARRRVSLDRIYTIKFIYSRQCNNSSNRRSSVNFFSLNLHVCFSPIVISK